MEDISSSSSSQVILFKVGALLSMAGSLFILRDAWIKFRDKKDIPLTVSLVFELSIFDFFSSFFGPLLGTWMVPKETGAYLASGTTASCTAQGFLSNIFYSSSVLCNTSLAITYCLIAKKGWRDQRPNRKGYYWLLRGIPLLSIPISTFPLLDDAYNYDGVTFCNIRQYPLGCDLDDSDVECTRGSNSFYFKLFAFFTLFVSNVIIISSISMLIHSVCAIEKKMSRYSSTGRANQNNSIKATWQGIWYIAAFGLAWWPFAIYNMARNMKMNPPIVLQYFYAITWPTQGVFNAIVYFRPKYKSEREKHKRDSRLRSVCRILRLSKPTLVPLKISTGKSRDDLASETKGRDIGSTDRKDDDNDDKNAKVDDSVDNVVQVGNGVVNRDDNVIFDENNSETSENDDKC